MAPFNPGLSPTNDPNYLNSSRGYSKSDVPSDTSLGKLFGDIGDSIGPVASAIDTTIQGNIRDDVYAAADKIRADHGGELSPDQIPAIAGKGSRGAKFAAAGGATDDLAMDVAVPAGVGQKVDGLKRMKAAYDAGQLSNSHYYSSLEAAVKEIRNRYPGYREQIDSMVSQITGVTPANALRSSVLQDMNSAQVASNAASNKIEAQFLKDREYIQTLYPGMTPQQYAAKKDTVDVAVGHLMARDYQIKAKEQSLGLEEKTTSVLSKRAETTFTDRANLFVDGFVNGTINQLQDRAEKLQSQGPNANPKEIQALTAEYQVLRGQMENGLRSIARQPLGSSGKSYSSYLKPDQISAISNNALAVLDPIINNLGNKNTTGVADAAANILKNRHQQDMLKMEDRFPTGRALKTAGDLVGPQGAAVVLQTSGILPSLNKAITDTAWLTLADKTNPNIPTASEILDAHGDTRTPKVTQVTVRGIQKLAENPDPEIAVRAVKSLYGDDKFFAGVPVEDKARVYTTLARPEFTAKMKQLGGEAYDTYAAWMEQNFPVVFKQGMDGLQTVITSNRMKWTFNPETLTFNAETLPQYRMEKSRLLPGMVSDPAPLYVAKLNEGLKAIAPILKDKYGADAPAHVASLIQRQPGMNFAAAPEGTVLEQLGGALSGWFKEHVKFTEPDNILGVKVDNIPEGMSARDFIRMLQAKETAKQNPPSPAGR